MKQIKSILVLILLITFGILLFLYRGMITALINPDKIKKTTINIIRDEKLAFLVTDKLVTQVVVEKSEYFSGLGRRSGYLMGTVKVYYGIDLTKIKEDSLEIKNNKIIIHLPTPEILDHSVDLSSLRFFTKETGMLKIASSFLNKEELRSELEKSLYKEALLFFKTNGMFPSPDNILLRFNSLALPIEKIIHLKVEFTLPERVFKLDRE